MDNVLSNTLQMTLYYTNFPEEPIWTSLAPLTQIIWTEAINHNIICNI